MKVPTAENPTAESMSHAESDGEQYIRRVHRLLANIYLHVCPLPKTDDVVKAICDCLPRVHYNGIMSLVHMFVMLMAESPRFGKIAEATKHFTSSSLSVAFGPGDEFEKVQCPMVALVTFVIEQDIGLCHEIVVHLTEFVHGVILYNDVHADRVGAVADLLMAVDDFYFDLSNGKPTRSACIECLTEDAFVARVYHRFGVMEQQCMLERENIDEESETNIANALAELLIVRHYEDENENENENENDEEEEVASCVPHDDLKMCDDQNL